LAISGLRVADYLDLIASVSYDAVNFVATWSLSTPLDADRFGLTVSSDLVTARGGGEFSQTMDILPGDVNRNSIVDLRDVQAMRGAFLSTAGDADYDVNADVDGSGDVDVRDLQQLRHNLLETLPHPAAASETNWGVAVDAVLGDLTESF